MHIPYYNATGMCPEIQGEECIWVLGWHYCQDSNLNMSTGNIGLRIQADLKLCSQFCSWVTLGKQFAFSEPHFSHLYNEDNIH